VNFRTVATKKIEEIEKIRFNSVNSRKECSKNGKKSTNFTNHKIEKKQKIHWYRGTYNMFSVCGHEYIEG
jgi:hypothetical protein